MDLISTKAAAAQLGVTASTIKRWADEGLLLSVRTAGGHRRFAADELGRAKARLQSPLGSDFVTAVLDELFAARTPQGLHGMLIAQRAAMGSWWHVAEDLGVVLAEVGSRWRDGSCSIVEEHLASRRLETAMAICGATIPLPEEAPTCLLATAEGDTHTLGLSLVDLCLRDAGWLGVWAGARTPTGELIARLKAFPTDLVCLSASSWSEDASALAREHRALATACRKAGVGLIVGGRGAWPERPRYGHRVRSLDQLRQLLRDQRTGVS